MPIPSRRNNRRGLPRAFGSAFGLLAFLVAHGAAAASVSFAPASGIRETGATFTVNVDVASPDQAINAADVVVGFPADRLQVVSLSKSGSIIPFWAEEPAFSNADGTVRLQGVIPNPGWKGVTGRLLSVTFRAKSEGTAALRFISGSVLADDGLGTNVLQGFGGASFSIVTASQAPVVASGDVAAAPAIVCPAFPDQGAWYKPGDLECSWKRGQGVNGASYLLDASPSTLPDDVSEGDVGSVKLADPGDGIRYLHLRVRDAHGWSDASHYRFKLDGAPPSTITMKEVLDEATGADQFQFDAVDTGSGVEILRLSIDGGQPFYWQPSADRPYEPPPLAPGKHTLRVEALDRAGNAAAVDFPFETAPPPAPTAKVLPASPTAFSDFGAIPNAVRGTPWESPFIAALAIAAVALATAFIAALRARGSFRQRLARYRTAIRASFAEAEKESAGHEHPGLRRAERLVEQAIRDLEEQSK